MTKLSLSSLGFAVAVGASIVLVSTSAFAQGATYSEGGSKTIARVGAQGTFYYVAFVEPLGQNCQFGTVYIASDRKGMYAGLLAAKLSNKRVSRVDYSQPGGAGTSCNAELIEIAD